MNTSNATLNTTQNTVKTLLSQVIEQLEQLLFCDLVKTYNNYADAMGFERINDNDEDTFNNIYESVWDAILVTNHKDYNDNDDYFVFNWYGNACSFSYQLTQDDNCPIDVEELAQWLIDGDKLSDYDIDVITLEDMLASVEDNITDDENMLIKIASYLAVILDNNSYEDNVYDVMIELNIYTYDQLQDIITMLGINI